MQKSSHLVDFYNHHTEPHRGDSNPLYIFHIYLIIHSTIFEIINPLNMFFCRVFCRAFCRVFCRAFCRAFCRVVCRVFCRLKFLISFIHLCIYWCSFAFFTVLYLRNYVWKLIRRASPVETVSKSISSVAGPKI